MSAAALHRRFMALADDDHEGMEKLCSDAIEELEGVEGDLGLALRTTLRSLRNETCPGCQKPLYDEKGSVGGLYGTLPDGSTWHSLCWNGREKNVAEMPDDEFEALKRYGRAEEQ